MDGREGWDVKRGGALAYPVVRDRAGLGWAEPPSERSERWRRCWVSEETRGMTGWETGFD